MGLFGSFLEILLYIAGVFLFLNCLYLLFFSLTGLKKTRPLKIAVKRYRKFCVLIPAYKEDLVVLESCSAALKHQYKGTFDVFVIADGLQEQTLKKLREMGAGVIEVSFERSTKGKALSAALPALPENEYELAMILDVDNIMDENVLEKVNAAFESGYNVVQTHRTAKNMNTPFSFLDACNEEINNHIYRKGPFAIGLSSALIGSGMAFNFGYLKKLLIGIGETIGEDKEIDFRIAKDKVKIAYLHHALIFDEKIENTKVFIRQRSRWLSAQLTVLKKYSPQLFFELKNANIEFINKLIQAWLVPRMLLIALVAFFLLLSFIIPYGPSTIFWVVLAGILFFTLSIALPWSFYKNKMFRKALWQLPYALFCMIIALFKMNKAKGSFMATSHNVIISSKSTADHAV